MNVQREDLPDASNRAMALTSAVLLNENDDVVAATIEEILKGPDPAASALTHLLGMTHVAFTAIALLAKARGVTIQEAIQEVALTVAKSRV